MRSGRPRGARGRQRHERQGVRGERRAAYREDEPLGGADPYSSSKACSELVTAAYRRSFFTGGSEAALATARAGNVIGGGDWAADRLVPDVMAALMSDSRSRSATRTRCGRGSTCSTPSTAISCSPSGCGASRRTRTVELRPRPRGRPAGGWVVRRLASCGGERTRDGRPHVPQPQETPELRLDSTRARSGSAGGRAGRSTHALEWTSSGTGRFAAGENVRARHARSDRGLQRERDRIAASDVRRPPAVSAARRSTHSSSTSACRRSRTPICAPTSSTRWSLLSAACIGLRACFLVQLEEFERPDEIFSDYAYFSSYSTSWVEHAEPMPSDGRALRLDGEQGGRGRKQRRLSAAVLRRARRACARGRAGGQRRQGGRAAGSADTPCGSSAGDRSRAGRRGHAADLLAATTCSRTCPT